MNKHEKSQHEQERSVQWYESVKPKPGADLMKNMAVAASLVLCAIALKHGAVPAMTESADALLTAVNSDTILDDKLGKLSFVSSFFPEATLVFGEHQAEDLAWPVMAGHVVHAWSEAEPYLSWETSQRDVAAACSGTVMAIYHGENEERLVQVSGEQGIRCIYGNLKETDVQVGDYVNSGDEIGQLLDDQSFVFEVFLDGVSVDPTQFLSNAT